MLPSRRPVSPEPTVWKPLKESAADLARAVSSVTVAPVLLESLVPIGLASPVTIK